MSSGLARSISLCVLGLACIIPLSTTQADVVALKRDTGLTADGATDVRFSSVTVRTVTVSDAGLINMGDWDWFNYGAAATGGGNTLFKFDVSSIPTGSTINLAQLRLYHTRGNGGLGDGDVSMVLTHDWTEGTMTDGYPGAAGGASFAHPNGHNTGPRQDASGGTSGPTQTWGPASDSFFSLSADAGSPIAPLSAPTGTGYHVFDVTGHVQQWVNGTKPNYGWANSSGYWDFHCSEAGTDYQPVLFVDYTAGSTIPPAAIGDLSAGSPTAVSIALTWTAPADPDSFCTAYDIRYSTSTITDANFASAAQVTSVPAPASPGTSQGMTVSGLTPATTYYFAIKTSDAVLNWSAISNVASGTTAASITFTNNTLTYGRPSDLGATIDPTGLNEAAVSYGISKVSFQALHPQVVAFDGAPAPSQTLRTLVAYYDATNTVTFAFPADMYNYGSMSSAGRGAFSGSALRDAISTVPTQPDSLLDWFDATISNTGDKRVTALGFCAAFRSEQLVNAGQVLFTLSDATTGTVSLPALGGAGNPEYVFIGYQAPPGKAITRVQASRTTLAGGGYVSIDDLSFVMTSPSDITPPAAVGDLAAGNATNTSIALTWTAPADPDSPCTAYDIRYSTATITEANFASAAPATGVPAPAASGTSQSMTVSGLTPSTTYYFAIKTSDAVLNWSAISNVASGTTAAGTIDPPAVTDLAAVNPTSTTITLTWTAPPDSSSTYTAYDIRYSTSPITQQADFAGATRVAGAPTPAAPGTCQSVTVSGLSPNTTYYFAMKMSDTVPNWSAISNSPGATTATSPNGKALLGPRDFKYKGYYIVRRGGDLADLAYGQGFTHRYVNGQLRFLTLPFFGNIVGGHHDHLVEFAPPASGLGGTITSRTNHWANYWGNTGLGSQGCWVGLWYDQANERLWTTWAVDYPDDIMGLWTKSIVVRTLNDDGTVSNVQGPWGLQGVQQRRIYGGFAAVPPWFQSAYGTGPYAAGWGGCASRMSYGVSCGPTFYTLPEPTAYPVGDIPASAFKTLMDHSAATLSTTWYANGFPTSYDRGVRNSDVQNELDSWVSPAPDGQGRWTWEDSNWNTGCWIETPNKQGFITVPKMYSGRTWYQTSTPHCDRQSAEIQVFDLSMLGQVAMGTRAAWNTYPTYHWQITDVCRPLGLLWGRDGNGGEGGPCGASYDSTTQTLYVYCQWGNNFDSYILVYDVDKEPAAVDDVALGETTVTGSRSGSCATGIAYPGNCANTETNDGVYESIREVAQGDTSWLEHKWTFNVTPGSSVQFNLKGYKTSNAEGDDFVFAYSTDGTTWIDMLTVSRTTDDGTFQTCILFGGLQGAVHVRVRDTDRSAGSTSLDTVYVDKMFFRSLPGTYLPGDVTGDNHVDVEDLLYLVETFGLGLGEPGYNACCDFNQDNSIDVVDLLTLVENFGT